MATPFPFGLRLDDDPGRIVGGPRRAPAPSRNKATVRFDYPPIEPLAPPAPPPPPEVAPEPAPAPSPTFSEATLAAAVAAARREGFAEATAKALARQPLADVEAMLREVVVRLEGLPWLELRLPPSLVAAGEAALAGAAEAAGYRGELRVIADPRLGPGDARLIWRDGAAERDLTRLEAQATALVEAWLPATGAEARATEPVAEVGRPAPGADLRWPARSAVGAPARPPEVAPERRAHEASQPAPTAPPLAGDAPMDGFA